MREDLLSVAMKTKQQDGVREERERDSHKDHVGVPARMSDRDWILPDLIPDPIFAILHHDFVKGDLDIILLVQPLFHGGKWNAPSTVASVFRFPDPEMFCNRTTPYFPQCVT